MNRKRIKGMALSLIAGILTTTVACSPEPTRTFSEAGPDWVETKLNEMSLDEKIGQMFLVGFKGDLGTSATSVSDHARKMIEDYHVGGIILFDRNIRDPEQVGQLNNDLQKLALSSSPNIPLFISVDQEGGKVARITEGVTEFPGNMALGATRDPALAYEAGKRMGSELRAMGINLNLAPSLDVNNNPQNPVIGVRSFSDDPKLVAGLGTSIMRGFRDGNVLTAVKHFPGHGDTKLDSHIDLPQVPHSMERLEKIELVPFRAAVENDPDMVMTTHITFPAMDPTPGLPATLSKKVLTDLLRNRWGYQGVIITDDMEMGAIAEHFGTGVAAVRAIQAGADVILVGHSLNKQEKAIETVKQAVEKGMISEERIDESVRRILTLKAKRLPGGSIIANPYASIQEIPRQTSQPETAALSLRIAERSVTLVEDKQKLLPLNPAEVPNLLVLTAAKPKTFGQVLTEQGFQATVVPISKLEKEQIPGLVKKAEQTDAVMVGASGIEPDSAQAELVLRLKATGKPVVVVGLDTPYDINALPKDTTYIAAYGSTYPTLQAVAKAMTGKIPFVGRLPVTVSQTFPFGAGILTHRVTKNSH
ncbi:beta-N-acetylhexosaminidase [Lihuaxuella thermophila]|uniref:Beta-N-acetylhexosaminidase n=1 Tax=Lihuaxuella thermophila TaxID=1173111 RepID=A0A1H8AGI7_9BACL|nr:beta-N-acetylhexosaminidase [Lihuaxuella thermophila]SEM69711.1 beta-N-acetylhexosaminidase [Lihuaxuella thermophila]